MAVDKKRLKILNLATYNYGGAGSASVVFNNFLNNAGHKSFLMVTDDKGKTANTIVYDRRKNYLSYKVRKIKFNKDLKYWNRLCRKKGFKENIVYDDQKTFCTAKSILNQLGFLPDIIFLHWTHNFITPEIVADLERLTGAKIISLLMDNAPITGGCHYPFECEGYINGCEECPLFGKPTSFSAKILKRKEKSYPKDMEFWATTSDCIRVKKSLLGKIRDVYPILFPIDEKLFPNREKNDIRKEYNIANDRKLLLVGCTSFNAGDNRKGLEYLLSILILIKERAPELHKNITLIIVGNNDLGIFNKIGYDICQLGFLPMNKLMEVYKMVDMFISTSIEDSGPLMVNQSIAVGTPVASFNIGVAEDLVVDKESGVKADLYDYDTLANKIIDYLSQNHNYEEGCINLYRRRSIELSPLLQLERFLK